MKDAKDALARASELRSDHQTISNRARVRAIMNGGPAAAKALLGDHVKDNDLPWANLMLSGMTRLAQKLGAKPDIRVDAPRSSDDERPRKAAEKRERIVEAYDVTDRMELQLPQAGRWMPGYGFAVWTIETRLSPDNIPYPKAELRDPYDCYPSAWGASQQPDELAVYRTVSIAQAKRLYPKYAQKIDQLRSDGFARGWGGGVLIGSDGQWENQTGRGLQVIEFYDSDGTHILMPAISERIDFIPNPLKSGPTFVVGKRFAFDALTGQYDHMIGLMAGMAKINILSVIAMQDAVFTETNVIGDKPLGGQYQRGRLKVNVFPPGTQVQKPQNNIPYQLFDQINRLERQARIVAGYPIQDDSQSPLSFATGAGLEELATGVTNEVREYQTVFKHALQDLDSKRLEFDEQLNPNRKKPLAGFREGVPYTESYTPSVHIKGNTRTRRNYGAMAGWDDSAKIVGGLQMLAADVIDVLTVQENIDGLENISQINERIAAKKAEDALRDALTFSAQQTGDTRAIMALIEMLPASEQKTILQKYFTPEEPQLSPEEEEFINGAQPGPLDDLFAGGAPPDVSTVLSRLTAAGSQGGVQTVARV